MATRALCCCICISLLVASILPSVRCGPHHIDLAALGWVPGGGSSPECVGTVAECLGAGEEFEMSSEISRRMLATTRYISYNALRRDSTPCSRRGASYYNCRPGAQANPYSRGCSAITRCRS